MASRRILSHPSRRSANGKSTIHITLYHISPQNQRRGVTPGCWVARPETRTPTRQCSQVPCSNTNVIARTHLCPKSAGTTLISTRVPVAYHPFESRAENREQRAPSARVTTLQNGGTLGSIVKLCGRIGSDSARASSPLAAR